MWFEVLKILNQFWKLNKGLASGMEGEVAVSVL